MCYSHPIPPKQNGFRFASRKLYPLPENKVSIWGWQFTFVVYTKTGIPLSISEKWWISTTFTSTLENNCCLLSMEDRFDWRTRRSACLRSTLQFLVLHLQMARPPRELGEHVTGGPVSNGDVKEPLRHEDVYTVAVTFLSVLRKLTFISIMGSNGWGGWD